MAQVQPVKAAFATAHGASIGVAPGHSIGRSPSQSSHRPVDLVHLSKQTLGDRSLEQEILQLFRSQSTLYLDRLEHAKTASERKMAAHTILGSARGLGAWQVAAHAAVAQENCVHGCNISELKEAVLEVNEFIDTLLD